MTRKKLTKAEREKVYQKYNGHCAYCGRLIDYKDMQVDHLVPLEGWKQHGTNDFENLMPSCRRCNHYKRANTLEGWRKMIEEIPQKLERDSYIYRVAIDYGLVEVHTKEIKFYFERGEQ